MARFNAVKISFYTKCHYVEQACGLMANLVKRSLQLQEAAGSSLRSSQGESCVGWKQARVEGRPSPACAMPTHPPTHQPSFCLSLLPQLRSGVLSPVPLMGLCCSRMSLRPLDQVSCLLSTFLVPRTLAFHSMLLANLLTHQLFPALSVCRYRVPSPNMQMHFVLC